MLTLRNVSVQSSHRDHRPSQHTREHTLLIIHASRLYYNWYKPKNGGVCVVVGSVFGCYFRGLQLLLCIREGDAIRVLALSTPRRTHIRRRFFLQAKHGLLL